MGNLLEIDLSKYGCTCFNQEDKNFLDFFEDIKEKSNPSLNTIISQENKTKNETTTLATTNKKYEKITYVPKNKENSVLNNKNY